MYGIKKTEPFLTSSAYPAYLYDQPLSLKPFNRPILSGSALTKLFTPFISMPFMALYLGLK